MPADSKRTQAIETSAAAEQLERRRQIRGLLLLAVLAIVVSILHAGIANVFTVGRWRLW